MTEEEIRHLYFEWLCNMVCVEEYEGYLEPYHDLLEALFNSEFIYFIPMDDNRYEDGIELRYRFSDDCNIDRRMIASILDTTPCSILEMMTALAIRCEKIMDDPDYINRTGRWFWDMIKSLGLIDMDNEFFDIRKYNSIISKFLKRDYSRSGEGGLFTINDEHYDMRVTEIWSQMCRYLDEILY